MDCKLLSVTASNPSTSGTVAKSSQAEGGVQLVSEGVKGEKTVFQKLLIRAFLCHLTRLLVSW